ncbi:MAG: FG-GAP repeat domain-containing protein, partial [Limisphaerales bacterium]
TNFFPTLQRNADGWLEGEVLLPAHPGAASTLSWADREPDGDLDLLMSVSPRVGSPGGTNVFGRNEDHTGLTLITTPASQGITTLLRTLTFANWQDSDLDGDADAALTGQNFSPFQVAHGRGVFAPRTFFPNTFFGTDVRWADLNGDRWIDVASGTGANGVTLHRRLNLDLFEMRSETVRGTMSRDSFWHDWDGDGDVDALLTDLAPTPDRARLLLNDGTGTFGDDILGGTAISGSLLGAADLDADGRLDLVTALTTNLLVWTRPDGTNFVSETLNVAGTDNPGFALADFDGDHRPDFFFTAQRGTTTNRVTAIFRNNFPGTNTPPAAPANLAAAVGTNEVAFSWDAAVDANQPGGLTYNVYVGTAPGRQDVLAAHSNPATGFRRQPQPGNNGLRRTRRLVNLYPGTYWWSVQAVDSAFAGGAFAAEQSFVIPTNQTPQVEFAWPPGGEASAVTGLAGWLTLEQSPDLRTWTAYRTNHFPAGRNAVGIGVLDGAPETFFRGRLEPR